MNKQEQAFIIQVKSMPCCICGASAPSEFHHICDTGRRLGHAFGLPLCTNCHRGNNGFSGKNRSAWDKSLANQLKLCKEVYAKLRLEMPEIKTKIVKRL